MAHLLKYQNENEAKNRIKNLFIIRYIMQKRGGNR